MIMPVNKPHDEFHTLDMSSDWGVQAGYPKGTGNGLTGAGVWPS
jgi:hypothetical protein